MVNYQQHGAVLYAVSQAMQTSLLKGNSQLKEHTIFPSCSENQTQLKRWGGAEKCSRHTCRNRRNDQTSEEVWNDAKAPDATNATYVIEDKPDDMPGGFSHRISCYSCDQRTLIAQQCLTNSLRVSVFDCLTNVICSVLKLQIQA